MNKNVKRIFSVFLCAVMIFSVFVVTGFADENKPEFRITVDGDIAVGNKVKLLVSLENMPEFTVADFIVAYNPSSLECLGIREAVKSDAEMWAGGIPEKGKAACSIFNFSPFKGQIDVAVVTFNVIDVSDTTVSISASGLDCSEIPEPADFDIRNTNTYDPSQSDIDYDYEIMNSEAVITDCNMESTGDLVIPETIEGYPVTTIKKSAFSNCDKITSVVIPDSVTTIEEFSFSGCDGLISVTIGSGVKTLGRSIFWDCKNLENAVVKNGVTYISEEMFSMCRKLKSVTLPDSIKKIEKSAFSNCYVLPEIHIPEYVETIEESAFYMCHSLKSIRLPKKITKIEQHTFYQCESLETVFFDGVITEIGGGAFAESGLNGFDVPGSVSVISSGAFANCKKLVTVNIGYGVTKICKSAFYGCTWLADIKIPSTVTEIQYMAIGFFDEIHTVTGFRIYGQKGSAAEQYAVKNRIAFTAVNADPDEGKYDVNLDGHINAVDARLALRASAQLETLTGNSFIAADIDKDGKVTAIDARKILRKAAQLD